ncbi:hypothetical protein [Ensifer sp. Root31]|uniref:hypothetical protein n=1 Tax=Ensifer sp. Root31 TaxID=1736512 RepID=UPI0012E7B9B3|nr:hypothetical protein [Ensifer sp. Root31]
MLQLYSHCVANSCASSMLSLIYSSSHSEACFPANSISLPHEFAAHIFRIFVDSYGQRLAALFDDPVQASDDVLGRKREASSLFAFPIAGGVQG